jgi:CHASE1-domain containing sensor protein
MCSTSSKTSKLLRESEGARDIEHGKNVRDSEIESIIHPATKLRELRFRAGIISTLILFLGLVTSGAFLGLGITSANREQEDQFRVAANDFVSEIESEFEKYENAAAMIHKNCRSRNFTRQDFRDLYEYLAAEGLEFKAIQFDPNVTRDERPAREAEAREFYAQHYPYIKYRGFVGFETDLPPGLKPRSEQDYYFPIHYMEPIPGNEAAIDLDYYSHVSRRQTLLSAMETGRSAMTGRLVLVKGKCFSVA